MTFKLKNLFRILGVVLIASILVASLASCIKDKGGSEKNTPQESVTLPHLELPPDESGEYEDEHLTNAVHNSPVQPSASNGKVSISFSSVVYANLTDRTITMHYINSTSNRDAIVALEISGVVIGKSHIVSPGTELIEMELDESVISMLQEGGYRGEFVVGFYCPETGTKDFVEATIPVKVYVKY